VALLLLGSEQTAEYVATAPLNSKVPGKGVRNSAVILPWCLGQTLHG